MNLTEDAKKFGYNTWVYCDQHLRPHLTGWCTVPNDCKVKLEATNAEEAYAECRRKGFAIFDGR